MLPAETRAGATAHAHTDAIADEVPVALVYNGISHAVMLATPCDLHDFAVGFSLTEGIVARAGEVRDVEIEGGARGMTVTLEIPSERFVALKERRRNLAGRTGCGLCGTESLDAVFRPLPTIEPGFAVDGDAIVRAFAALGERQPLHAATGAVHAAGWAQADGTVAMVREDVGRHNAFDKLIGAMARAGVPFDDGFALLTSRASSEMVQKAATMRIPMLAAISAPTALAVQLADDAGLTLAAFVRGNRYKVYTHGERIHMPVAATTP
ncbi:MAG: formate dehydrogenase accessory sulfurtransferase FdhD [Proteobacteria bacterium]|nr:formate dehydrogenase accessory sulfurtransferase FdhD [Pseudomonadota bacterium]